MWMYLAFFIGMLLPLKWDYSTPVMYPLCQSVDGSLHGMLAADTETFRMYADIISRGVYAKCNLQIICKCFAIIAGCLRVVRSAWALAGCGNPCL